MSALAWAQLISVAGPAEPRIHPSKAGGPQ